MFGYVIPPLQSLGKEAQEQFQELYCGLCHTLGNRFGLAARFILNYDFAFLAILLSDQERAAAQTARCPASPFKRRCYQQSNAAMELAADESVILSYWQLRDGVTDNRFLSGLKYRLLSTFLYPAYRKATRIRPEFDQDTRIQLQKLSKLEQTNCKSMDTAADTFAELLAAAANSVSDETHRRVLRQILYHLGRWIYLVDAADDLKKDAAKGAYNPLIVRYELKNGELDEFSRKEFVGTLDHSVHLIATAYELWDFGDWSPILEATIYSGLFQVGKAVLDGTFQTGFLGKRKNRLLRKLHEQSLSDPRRL